MAKGQKRKSREAKKPKQSKTTTTVVESPFARPQQQAPSKTSKKG